MVRSKTLARIVASAGLLSSCQAKNCTSREYDYVIVGGGLTGLVAAARLSEDSNGV